VAVISLATVTPRRPRRRRRSTSTRPRPRARNRPDRAQGRPEIIDFRTKNGGFKKIEEIMKAQGIGEKVYENIKDLITVGGETAPK
jgi:hypothetical protein